jgi:hypothetical protein
VLNLTPNPRARFNGLFEGVGLTGPCLRLGLMAVPRLLSPNFKKHLEFGHVANVDHLMMAQGRVNLTSHVDRLSNKIQRTLKIYFYQQGLTTKTLIDLLYIYCDVLGSLNRW